jgi:hypothetical protein
VRAARWYSNILRDTCNLAHTRGVFFGSSVFAAYLPVGVIRAACADTDVELTGVGLTG